MEKKLVGGQAVIEGVMMRCASNVATAVRKDGKITVKTQKVQTFSKTLSKVPFVRGVISLFETLIIGIKTLEYSAQQAAGEEEKISSWAMAITLIVSLGAGILLFVLVPYFFTNIIGFREQTSPVFFNLVDGGIKLAILVGYIAFIGTIKDVKTVFQYHGAEHKAVACYEHGKKLTVENCSVYSTKHTRCGTSFLMFVILIGIVVFVFIPLIIGLIWPAVLTMSGIARYMVFFSARILLLPVIAGVSYELLRISARLEKNAIVSAIIFPGLLVQKLTTKEPSNKQIEVAIAALKAVV